jgi:2-succinyl-5-enolpyruvyl-6-hydroxy-3-cyclohexene-1-carboxylate synthase
LAVSERSELRLHVRLDERSAGFFALGRALATTLPVAVVVTSGTAAAELHAAVAEADLAFVPLVVITADRPPELHGVGAPQVIEQGHLYGDMVRLFQEPGVASPEYAPSWRPLAKSLWSAACGDSGPPGPVHLNAAFVEPLIGAAGDLPARDDTRVVPTVSSVTSTSTGFVSTGQKVLCVVGRGVSPSLVDECTSREWVILGDATAQGTLPHFDAMLRSGEFARRVRPDVVFRLGGLPASKVLGERLREWRVRTVAFTGAGFVADPDRLISETLVGLPSDANSQKGDVNYAASWRAAAHSVEQWLESLDDADALSEPLVARSVVSTAGERGVSLVVGSSMPVRDVEWWAPPRRSSTFANRGVNGIDGVVSTVLGVGAASQVLGLVGDLTMLHDVSGLVDGLGSAGGSAVLVVLDNRGGGIFSFLPQSRVLERERFELLFGTPRPHDLEAVARAFGHEATTVSTSEELRAASERGLAREGLSVIVARVPSREDNVRLHDEWNSHVAALVRGEST